MLKYRWILLGLSLIFGGSVRAGTPLVLFDFETPSQITGWVYPQRMAGTTSGQGVANGGSGTALQISWTVLQNTQDWLIVSYAFSPAVVLDGYRYLSMDVKPGPENIFTNLKLVSMTNSFEDALTNIDPAVVPGQWTRIRLDLTQTAITGQLVQVAFFIGTHWSGVQVGRTYTLTVDNVVLEEGTLPVYEPPAVEVRPRRNVFFSGERGEFKIIDRRNPPVSLLFRLLKNGAAYYQKYVTGNATGVVVDVGVLYAGSYEARAGNLDNATVSCVASAAHHCRYDWDGTLERNGSKLFPVGLHFLEENATDAELAGCAASGFNAAPRPFDDPANGLQILNRVNAAANASMFILGGPYDNHGQKTNLQYWQDVVSYAPVRQHPALLGWYIDDEPGLAQSAELAQITAWVKQQDPYHPTYAVLNSSLVFDHYAPMFDVLGGDIYPYPSRPISVVGDFLDRLGQACHYRKPVIAVLQAFRDVGSPAPPASVVRAMSYLAIAHRVKGLMYFAFAYQGAQPPEDAWRLPQSDPVLWAQLNTLASEIRSLSGLWLNGIDPGIVLNPLPAAVHHRLLEDSAAETRYLLLVNTEPAGVGISLNLPGCANGTRVTSIFDNQTFAGPTVQRTLDGYDVALYRWSLHFDGSARVRGAIELQDFAGSPDRVLLNVELRQGGSPVGMAKVIPAADGTFTIDNVTGGTYDVAIKACAWLQKIIRVEVAADPTDMGLVSLIAGDNDGDNEVTTSDLATVLLNMDQVGD